MKPRGLLERLSNGESVICGEGYTLELERRGYIQSGVFTPEVVLDHPERVISLHEEFAHAGSDVVEAFTYYGHREKLRTIGREDDLEKLNLAALRMAREVADRHGCLMAGNICNTSIYDPDEPKTLDEVRDMFKEQVEWAMRGKADMMIAETYKELGEAKLALEAIKTHGQGLPAVITLASCHDDVTVDDVPMPQALRQLEEMGAAVVGLNCGRGPATMLPLLRECRKVCKGPLAALPVAYRTTDKQRTWHALTDPQTGKKAYPLELSGVQCSRSDIQEFAREARALGVQYIGLCCGNCSMFLREIAQEYGRNPPGMKYAPNLKQGSFTGGLYKRAAFIMARQYPSDEQNSSS